MQTLSFYIHAAGVTRIVSTDAIVMRRIISAAQFTLSRVPDRTEVEQRALNTIQAIQSIYPELI